MKNLRILVDTNVLVDYISNRVPFAEDAYKIIELCIKKEVAGAIAAHTITNLYFILRKELPPDKRRNTLLKLCRVFTVVGLDSLKLESALRHDIFEDFEDGLQDECAKDFQANFIITRNLKDFSYSNITAIEPKTFLQNLK